ncbi:ABC transporter ATP-binding protein [Halobacteriales archaeon QS_3_64_16]|nr:MAG: ABC transporter ATP-binding protein [Halobacteriales archaeon QS_3_64_16]
MTLEVDVAARFTATGTDPFVIDVAFSVEEGESLVILGPSGSGKTLVLETIAGFHLSKGAIRNGDRDLTDLPSEKRDFGFVFQDYALFPHMTVRENVAFGARYHEETRDPETVLAELGVANLADRTPPTLSGGEAQRVALARSLAIGPEVFLLDEPLSALDVPTRQALRDDVADLLADVTAVYVTHNRTTARAIADRIAIMRDGELVQRGTPETIFERPASPFVARFTGANCLPLDALGEFGRELREREGDEEATHVALRPEYVELEPEESDLETTVQRCTREDATNRLVLSLPAAATEPTASSESSEPIGARSTDGGQRSEDDRDLTLEVFSDRVPESGAEIGVSFPREHLTLLDDSDEYDDPAGETE